MSTYLVIENSGEVEAEAFLLMGASTKRDESGKIGQFGTGTKYALATLIDYATVPVVMSGLNAFKFSTKLTTLRGKAFEQVLMSVAGKKQATSFTNSMGLNWTVEHALRELVSNAYDEDAPIVYKATAITGEPGYTRIFVPFEGQVQDFFARLSTWFTAWRTRTSGLAPIVEKTSSVTLFRKQGPGCRVYRRGVLAYENLELESAFDYDLDELNVHEDRKADDWDVRRGIEGILDRISKESKQVVLDTVVKHQEKSLEGKANVRWSLYSDDWKELLANRVVVTPAVMQAVGEELKQRNVAMLPESWVEQMTALKVTTAKDVLTTAKLKGYSEGSTLIPAHAIMLEQALAFLKRAGFDTTVAVNVFQSQDPNAPLGEYVAADDRVLLNLRTFELGLRQLIECLVEEFLHRKSGECDKTRSFQNALIRELVEVIVRLTGETL
jgi:hypothetical protein